MHGVPLPVSSMPVSHWVPPKYGKLKLKVVAALDVNSKSLRLGVMIRDEFGSVIFVSCIHRVGTFSVNVGEAMTILGLKLASSNGWCLSQACSDACLIVCQVNQFPRSLTDEGVLVEAINEEMHRRDLSSIVFTPRSTNRYLIR